jgi:5-methylcytosine-specific restriction enzyme A
MSNPFYQSLFWRRLRAEALKRDGWRCTVPGCHATRDTTTLHVDHIATRPPVAHATGYDVLSNLRTLCDYHDRQVKEQTNGQRRNAGRLTVPGCDANGHPIDPRHFWNRGR